MTPSVPNVKDALGMAANSTSRYQNRGSDGSSHIKLDAVDFGGFRRVIFLAKLLGGSFGFVTPVDTWGGGGAADLQHFSNQHANSQQL